MADGGKLDQTRHGTLVFWGINSFVGVVNVQAGLLDLAAPSGADTGAVKSMSVLSGATLLVSKSNKVSNAAADAGTAKSSGISLSRRPYFATVAAAHPARRAVEPAHKMFCLRSAGFSRATSLLSNPVSVPWAETATISALTTASFPVGTSAREHLPPRQSQNLRPTWLRLAWQRFSFGLRGVSFAAS